MHKYLYKHLKINLHDSINICFSIFLAFSTSSHAQNADQVQNFANTKIDGYRGIWFELNQKLEYGDKYSGGLGTYTAKHMPMAIYSAEVDKTFFVFGGTTQASDKHLLGMIGFYDHSQHLVAKPTVVFDKVNVDDPHDNPSLSIDRHGYIWVFISGRGTIRPGYKLRSLQPFEIDSFVQVSEEEMTYPQPWYSEENGFFHFFTKYSGTRELYFEVSKDGNTWTEDRKLSGIVEVGKTKAGHYQVTGHYGNKFGTFFNRHIDGHPDTRTDLYYLETSDLGKSWQNANGEDLVIPLIKSSNSARVHDFQSQGKNVYVKDLQYDKNGSPICLFITSGGFAPGPINAPYEWTICKWNGHAWSMHKVCESDHNYDMGSLFITDSAWYVIGPTEDGARRWAAGGEIVIWSSSDEGLSWKIERQVTSNSPLNHTYVRRPLHAKEPFLYYWADGDPTILSQSNLYFGDLSGQTWQLPYHMKEDLVEPRDLDLKR